MNRTRNHRGMLLYELLAVLVLLAVLGTLASELVLITLKTIRDSEKQQVGAQNLDRAISLLRQDTWAASAISFDSASARVEFTAANRVVSWQSDPAGKLIRTVRPISGDVQTLSWQLPPAKFTVKGPLLTFTLHTPGHEETLTLVSQAMLQGAAR